MREIKNLDEILEDHEKWLARDGGSRADLSYANLSGAKLSGANLDYSCLPLWCGSLSAHFDDRHLAQIAYHLVKAGLQSKNVPFGFAYQKEDGGYRVAVIPTVPFYLWYTNQNGRNVMAGEENLYKEEGA